MDRSSLVFCVASLIVSLGVSALAYPFATVDRETLANYRTPAEAALLPDLELGDFGTITVSELVDYYLENPPPPPAAGAAPQREVRFQGC